MGEQKQMIGFDRRLRRAMKHGPKPMSTRRLAKALQDQFPGLRGTSPSGVRFYVEGGPKDPRVELLRAMADVMGIRPEYLIWGEGPMTKGELLAETAEASARRTLEQEELEKMRSQVKEALFQEIPRLDAGGHHTLNHFVGLIGLVVRRDPRYLHAKIRRVFSAAGVPLVKDGKQVHTVRDIRQETEINRAAARIIARAVMAPADVLEIDLDKLSPAHFDLYVNSACAALAILVTEPRKMIPRELWDAYANTVPHGSDGQAKDRGRPKPEGDPGNG